MASNNWAVAPSRSATEHALLAGDPHLDLTLPSIWYEAHLVVPGRLDVYGVTIPGAPAIVIGFNRDVAWTFTNTGADVMDLYAEAVDDRRRPTRYRVDGAWRPLEPRVEVYRGTERRDDRHRHACTSRIRGPLQRVRGRWLSMRWTVLEARTRELDASSRARARASAAEFQDAMARYFSAPAQNMLAADRGGTHRHPLDRPLSDPAAATAAEPSVRRHASANDWQGDRPRRAIAAGDRSRAGLPRVGQPAAGRSARDPPSWLGGRLRPVARAAHQRAAARRQRRHGRRDAPLPDRSGQRARRLLRALLPRAPRCAWRQRGTGPNPPRARASAGAPARRGGTAATPATNTGAVLFEAAMREAALQTWDELAAAGRRTTR